MNRPAVTIPLAAAAFVGMALGAAFAWHQISGPPLRSLDATVANLLDHVEQGDTLAFWATDPDCVQVAPAAVDATGWTFTAMPAQFEGNTGRVFIEADGPGGAARTTVQTWHLDRDGQWRQIADGTC